MKSEVTSAKFSQLTDIQRLAMNWDSGSLMVLAGPGSGKTRVLTSRIAHLLESSKDQHFRILALTFTNRAANEMISRVQTLVPDFHARARISTFHGFCAQVLRQHGMHVGVKPDFVIYSQVEDRQCILRDALMRNGQFESIADDHWLLPVIDRLKADLVLPEHAKDRIEAGGGVMASTADRVALAYQLYEHELRRSNALDFNSLILGANQLFAFPVFSKHFQRSYPYWLIDEFQDTNEGQYRLLRTMASDRFRNVFVVADDDQTIFEWNGTSARRISEFVIHFRCKVLQFPTNYRCSAQIVDVANRLLSYNSTRMKKTVVTAARGELSVQTQQRPLQYREYATEAEEAAGIAEEVHRMGIEERGRTAVLARNMTLLTVIRDALLGRGMDAVISKRRDDFVSPEMRWIVSCLRQIVRPIDRRNIVCLTEAFASFANHRVDFEEIEARSQVHAATYLSAWLDIIQDYAISSEVLLLSRLIDQVNIGTIDFRDGVNQILAECHVNETNYDLKDDIDAWRRVTREIDGSSGSVSLERFLKELDVRSKEPIRSPGSVVLATIHGAKGREFDTVYLAGLAEEVFPSWHSVKKGIESAEMEQERRACFVAITRARYNLVLSHARSYRGWRKMPSRFLTEMEFPESNLGNDHGVHIGSSSKKDCR